MIIREWNAMIMNPFLHCCYHFEISFLDPPWISEIPTDLMSIPIRNNLSYALHRRQEPYEGSNAQRSAHPMNLVPPNHMQYSSRHEKKDPTLPFTFSASNCNIVIQAFDHSICFIQLFATWIQLFFARIQGNCFAVFPLNCSSPCLIQVSKPSGSLGWLNNAA